MNGISEQGPYKMRTIARLTDFSPALLRAWERRHDLLHPMRGPGGHRLYTDDDLRVLLRVKDLIAQGRAIGEIARLGRESLLREGAARAREILRPSEPAPLETPRPELQGELERWRDTIVQAAVVLDSSVINRALDESFARVAAETVIFEVIQPCARRIGDLWEAGKCTVASEHLASGMFVHRLRRLVEVGEPGGGGRPVLVACFPDEYHQLGALMVSYLLTRHGLRVSFLGAALPFEDLEGGCDVLQPTAVLLSVTRPEIFRLHRRRLCGTLRELGRVTPCFLGGRGAPKSDPVIEALGGKLITDDVNSDDIVGGLVRSIRAPMR